MFSNYIQLLCFLVNNESYLNDYLSSSEFLNKKIYQYRLIILFFLDNYDIETFNINCLIKDNFVFKPNINGVVNVLAQLLNSIHAAKFINFFSEKTSKKELSDWNNFVCCHPPKPLPLP